MPFGLANRLGMVRMGPALSTAGAATLPACGSCQARLSAHVTALAKGHVLRKEGAQVVADLHVARGSALHQCSPVRGLQGQGCCVARQLGALLPACSARTLQHCYRLSGIFVCRCSPLCGSERTCACLASHLDSSRS